MTAKTPSEPAPILPLNSETCQGTSGSEYLARNPYSSGAYDTLCHDSGLPRTEKGGIDVEECLRRVRAGWGGSGTSPWALPSTGSPGHGCGTHLASARQCGDCIYKWPIWLACRGWVCPGCSPSRVRQMAMGAAIKLEAVLTTLILDGEYRGHRVGRRAAVRRAVLSPPRDRWPPVFQDEGHQRMKQLKKTARDLAQQKGFLGGCLVFHPWRDTNEKWRFDVEGPHFHLEGPSTWLESGGDDDQDEGWIFEVNPRWYRRVPVIFEVIAYDLTHVGVVPNRPAVTWWGAAHGRALGLEPRVLARIAALEDGSHAVCPQCNGTNTYTVMATSEDLELWGVKDRTRTPGRIREPPTQNRFVCDDCGTIEPVPPKKRPGSEIIEKPWTYRESRRQLNGQH